MFLLAVGCATQQAPAPEAAQNEAAATATQAVQPTSPGTRTVGLQPAAVVSATDLLSNLDFEGKTVRVAGRVADVCQKAGCWMILTDDTGKKMRIRMKDHGLSIAKDGEAVRPTSKRCGRDRPRPRHGQALQERSKNLDAIPEGEGEKKTWEMVASGVRMKRPSPT